mgnify:CR=1 FL=1
MSINKIKKSKDFSLIYNKSQKMHTKYAIIFIKENVNNEQRFGFVASKKTGNAVQRNRVKRIFKEFVKIHKDKFKKNTDYIFVGKSVLKEKIKKLKKDEFENENICKSKSQIRYRPRLQRTAEVAPSNYIQRVEWVGYDKINP